MTVVGVGAQDRMVRVLSLAIGAAGLMFLLARGSYVVDQLGVMELWWAACALPAIVAPFIVLMVGSFWLPVRWLRGAAAVLAAAFLLVLATVPLGFERYEFTRDYTEAWPLMITSVVLAAVALVTRGWGLAGYVLAFTPVHAVATWWVTSGATTTSLVRYSVWIPVLGLIFALVSMTAIRAGRLLDADIERLRRQAATHASAAATARERSRVGALVHDSVLSALLAGGRSATGETAVRAAARQGLVALDELAAPREDAAVIPAGELAARLRHTCAEVDERLVVRFHTDDASLPVSVDVARVLHEVVGEAVRNSVRHAAVPSHQVDRWVDLLVDQDSVTARVGDNGAGFDPGRVPSRCLGIAVGMRERVRRLRGAELSVASAPGVGTVVHVSAPPQAQSDDDGGKPGAASADAEHQCGATTVTEVVGMHTVGAAVLAAAYLATEAFRPFDYPAPQIVGPWYACALVALLLATVLLLRRGRSPYPLSLRVAVVVAAAPVLAAAANTAVMQGAGPYPLSALWAWAPGTIILSFLAVRGRVVLAWAGQVGMAAVYLAAVSRSDVQGNVLGYMDWQVLSLAACTVFAVAVRRQVRQINLTRARTVVLAGARADAEARLRERDEQLAYLDQLARPVLERMANEGRLDGRGRERALLVEARLRDRIRAHALAAEPVLDAAEAARTRGVEVVLLDDGALADAGLLERAQVCETVCEQLRAAMRGSVTIRVLPPGRDVVCTILHTERDRVARVEIRGAEAASAPTSR